MSVNSSRRKCSTVCCPLLFLTSSLSIEKEYNYDNDILQILESDTDNEARFRSLVAVGTLVSVCRLWLVTLQAALIVLDWSLSDFWLLQLKRYLDLISPDKHLPVASKFTSLRMLFCQSVPHANWKKNLVIPISFRSRWSKTVLYSGFHAVDSWFQLLDQFRIGLPFRAVTNNISSCQVYAVSRRWI